MTKRYAVVASQGQNMPERLLSEHAFLSDAICALAQMVPTCAIRDQLTGRELTSSEARAELIRA